MIADYHKGQSLVETLLANGIGHVALTDWKSARADMKDLEIDNYLAEVVVAIDDLGGRVDSRRALSGRLGIRHGRSALSREGECAGARGLADRY